LINPCQLVSSCVLAACALALGCGNPYGLPDPADSFVDSEDIRIDSVETESISDMEGPYIFIKARTLNEVVLADNHANTGLYYLVGLKIDEYQDPGLVNREGEQDDHGLRMTPDEVQAVADRKALLQKLRSDALQDHLGDGEFWIMRMANTHPAPIYLFRLHDDVVMQDQRPVSGGATLINAELVRKGSALMEVMGRRHPYYQRMLDCQAKAILDQRHGRDPGLDTPSIWKSFDLYFPEDRPGKRFRYVEELLYR